MATLFLFSCGAEDQINKPHANIGSQPFADLLQEEGALLLDVRTPSEHQSAKIDGSTLVPINQFEDYISSLPKDKDTPILVYCHSGSRSRFASQQLSALGYTRVYNLARGILDWYQQGYPIVQ
jgi:rhodanese-related sulfurtransferase